MHPILLQRPGSLRMLIAIRCLLPIGDAPWFDLSAITRRPSRQSCSVAAIAA
jgi:hypothetical protein